MGSFEQICALRGCNEKCYTFPSGSKANVYSREHMVLLQQQREAAESANVAPEHAISRTTTRFLSNPTRTSEPRLDWDMINAMPATKHPGYQISPASLADAVLNMTDKCRNSMMAWLRRFADKNGRFTPNPVIGLLRQRPPKDQDRLKYSTLTAEQYNQKRREDKRLMKETKRRITAWARAAQKAARMKAMSSVQSVVVPTSDSDSDTIPSTGTHSHGHGNAPICAIEGCRETCYQHPEGCLLYTSPSPRDGLLSRMPSSA